MLADDITSELQERGHRASAENWILCIIDYSICIGASRSSLLQGNLNVHFISNEEREREREDKKQQVQLGK